MRRFLRGLLRARGNAGQIVIPALFIFPTLMLFVFLIFETAKLSREKIRHQFAVDAAAFVEMTNYSDFLNRSAYVNGAFPMRIFREGFHDTNLDCQGLDPCPGPKPLDDVLWGDGLYPRSISQPDKLDDKRPQWDIQYDPASVSGERNSASPTIQDPMTLVSENTAIHWWIRWDEADQVYKLFVQIYQLLGSVESAQYSVLKRLSSGHNFLKKSYWLNTGGPTALAEGAAAADNFDNSAGRFIPAVQFHCVGKVMFWGKNIVHSAFQPYNVQKSDPLQMNNTIPECSGLFQLVTVTPSVTSSMGSPSGGGSYPGWPVEAHWSAPDNYFSVPLNNMLSNSDDGPRVHATVSARGWGAQAAVWPDPTPKFQVRLFP